MIKILHLTDLHLCPAGETVVTFDPEARLADCIADIHLRHADADLCVVTGDLTDRGDVPSYVRLRQLLETMIVPVRLLLGNHDRRTAFKAVFPEAPADENGFIQSALDLDDIRLIFLDTLDESQPGGGVLCRQRLAWAERHILDAGRRNVTVFLHHPPFDVGVEYFRHMLLAQGGDALLDLLSNHLGVRHLVFGHCHINLTGQRRGISFSGNCGTCHPIDVELQGHSVKYVDRKPAYDILLLDRDRIITHTIELVGAREIVAVERADLDGGPGWLTILQSDLPGLENQH